MTDPTPPAVPAPAAPLAADVPVSIVLCVLNEERHVASAIADALDQDHAGQLELVVALGPSTDRTDTIVAELAAGDPRVRSVRNPSPTGATPSGLNAAVAASRFPVVVRVDGHAHLPRDYVRTAVETLSRTGADNVGGIMAAEGVTAFEKAVAAAMTSPFGVGGASFHTGGEEGPADTVYLGAFRRSALERVGGYDDHFLRAQDWEMNLRIRRTGGLVWFQPAMRVSYRPRRTLAALARQYRHYGRWRRVVMRTHPGTANLRYLTPPAVVIAVAGGAVAGLFWWPALVLPAGYLAGVLGASVLVGRGLSWRSRAAVPGVLVTMHLSWGWGFLTSPRRLARGAADRSVPAAQTAPSTQP
ncbi:MAG: glycosyltransferase family 2 protein [Kineosporiaceae bacterium]